MHTSPVHLSPDAGCEPEFLHDVAVDRVGIERAAESRVLQQKQAAGDDETVEILKGISPVAWQHVNLFGRFEFNKRDKVDLAALVKVFDEPQCWTRITQQNVQED